MPPKNAPQRHPEPTDDELEALTDPNAETPSKPTAGDPPKATKTRARSDFDIARVFAKLDADFTLSIASLEAKLAEKRAAQSKLRDETPDRIKAIAKAAQEASK
jgi:hypothetical protein